MNEAREQREWRRTAFALLLALNAGAVDASGFLLLAGLFPAHVTGNSVHVAIDLSVLTWTSAAEYAAVILCFGLGVAAGTLIIHHAVRGTDIPSLTLGLAVECALILATLLIGVLMARNGLIARAEPAALLPALAPVALAMGFQNTIIRDRRWRSVHTTYVTGTLVTAVEEAVELALRGGARQADRSGFPPEPSAARLVLYGGVFVCYVAGALAAALIERRVHFWAFGLPLAGLLAALVWDRLRPFYL